MKVRRLGWIALALGVVGVAAYTSVQRVEATYPVGAWRYQNPQSMAAELTSHLDDELEIEVELRKSYLYSVRIRFDENGTVEQTPFSPWDSARWTRDGDEVRITADRYGDAPGPHVRVYRIESVRLIDLTNAGWDLRRAD